MRGSMGFTTVLAGLAIVISIATYIANKRRSSETHTPSHTTHRGDVASLSAAGSQASPSAAVHRSSYYAVRAERHVSRCNASTVQWCDEVLGVRMVFSPILFAVEREERQAPLVLVALRYLRHPEHSVTVTFEACTLAETAVDYRDSSLERVRDCAKILAMGTTRIGSVQCPLAEYCYLDSANRLRYALSVFLTHDRLAVTAQYVADTRVKGVLPTAFNELVRSVEFSAPRGTPSYLLCAEPRLGIGFRLPLDFVMNDSLRDAVLAPFDDVDDAPLLAASTGAPSSSNNSSGYSHPYAYNSSPAPVGLGANSNGAWGGVPFAVAVGRGARRMALVASYDPPGRSWPLQVQRQLRVALARVGAEPTQEEHELEHEHEDEHEHEQQQQHQKPVVRPYQRSIPATGDAAAEESDASHVLNVDGAFCVRPVRLAAMSPCAAFIRDDARDNAAGDSSKNPKAHHVSGVDTFEEESARAASAAAAGSGAMAEAAGPLESRGDGTSASAARPHAHTHTHTHAVASLSVGLNFRPPADVPAHLCLFCLRVGEDDYVSFVFLASATRHTLEEFITFCRRTLDSLTLGNHFGQSASLTYCNVRHEVLPFHIPLGPACTVEETAIGDPVAILRVGAVVVVLRVFPCAGAARLERAVQHYFMMLPENVRVRRWDAAAVVGARAALEVEYTCGHEVGASDSIDDIDVAAFNEEAGHINPFAQCGALLCEETGTAVRSPSVDSRETAEGVASRVALIVREEGCAFLFLATVGAATIWETRAAVRKLAAGLTITST